MDDKMADDLMKIEDAKSILDDIVKDFINASAALEEYLETVKNPFRMMFATEEEVSSKVNKFRIYMLLAANKIDAINIIFGKDEKNIEGE